MAPCNAWNGKEELFWLFLFFIFILPYFFIFGNKIHLFFFLRLSDGKAPLMKTRNAMPCNSRDDLLHFSFTFSEAYITQSNTYDGSFMWNYNHGHNIMKIFDVLPNFPFTTSERSLIISDKLVYTSCLTSCRTT